MLLKRRLRHRYFPKNFARFLRAPSDKAIMKRSKQETNYFNHSTLENRSKYKICKNLCSKLHKIEKKEKKKFYSSLSDINDNKTPIPDFGVVGGASWTFNPSMQALNLTFLATTVSYELKKRSNYRCQNLNNRNLLFLVEITSGSPDLYC